MTQVTWLLPRTESPVSSFLASVFDPNPGTNQWENPGTKFNKAMCQKA